MTLPYILAEVQPDHTTTTPDIDSTTIGVLLHLGACLERLCTAINHAYDVMTDDAHALLVNNVMTLLEWRTTDDDDAMTA